jgi:hypothetical protein
VLPAVRVEKPFPMAPLPVESARDAYDAVLEQAGATRPRRDVVDRRTVELVRTGTVTDAAGKGIITDAKQAGGYPEYKGEPVRDADRDGMPDGWEVRYGLDPDDPSDAAKDCNGDGYTNIEKYINGLDPVKKVDWTDLKNNVDPLAPTR